MLGFTLEMKSLRICLSDTIDESLTQYTNFIFLCMILISLSNASPYLTVGGSCNPPTPGILHAQDTRRYAYAVCMLVVAYFL